MKKNILAITLIIASLVLAGCSVDTAQLAGSSNNVKVPNIIGMSLQDAKDELTSAGLQIGDTKYQDSDEDKDTVLQSDPLPGTGVEGNSKIDLTLASGERKEPTLIVKVPMPDSNDEVELTVYIDGELDSSYNKTVDPAQTSTVTFKFKGTSGKKQVDIKADDKPYKSYTLDFDKHRVIENNES